ncbi:hypothetical protein ACOME3_007758 [Neoechinorhynchus agilis]
MFAQYDEIVANKTSLEFEINTYRRLLEGEEAHVSKMAMAAGDGGLYQSIGSSSLLNGSSYKQRSFQSPSATASSYIHEQQHITTTKSSPSQPPKPPAQTEMQAKTTYQRSAKGPVSIAECSPDGRLITLENTSKNKDIELSGWKLYRKVDQNPEIVYQFPYGQMLNNSRMLRIWASGGQRNGRFAGGDLVNNAIETWGVGVSVSTRLVNDQGDEKATHVQRTVYASSS